jgi:hypothetical protein
LVDRLAKAHEIVRELQYRTLQQDSRAEPLFKESDFVWLECKQKPKGKAAKLQAKYKGPFKITKVFENNTYLVDQNGRETRENERRLKLVTPATQHWGQAPTSREMTRQKTHMGKGLGRTRRPANSNTDDEWLPPLRDSQETEGNTHPEESPLQDDSISSEIGATPMQDDLSRSETESTGKNLPPSSSMKENESTPSAMKETESHQATTSSDSLDRGQRNRRPPMRYGDYVLHHVHAAPLYKGETAHSHITVNAIQLNRSVAEHSSSFSQSSETDSISCTIPSTHPSIQSLSNMDESDILQVTEDLKLSSSDSSSSSEEETSKQGSRTKVIEQPVKVSGNYT